ncbi:MAG: PepSY-like domain-containing protein [bacterium]
MKQKTILTVIFLMLASSVIAATNTEVPQAVLEKFKEMYTDASNVNWYKMGNEYEAEFTRNGKNYEASYKQTGEWRETGTIIEKGKEPVAIRTSFGTLFPDAEMLQVVLIEKGVRGSVYEVEYKEDGETQEIYLKPDGDRVPDFSEDEEEKYDRD